MPHDHELPLQLTAAAIFSFRFRCSEAVFNYIYSIPKIDLLATMTTLSDAGLVSFDWIYASMYCNCTTVYVQLMTMSLTQKCVILIFNTKRSPPPIINIKCRDTLMFCIMAGKVCAIG